MGVRSAVASTLVRAAKAFGPVESAPQAMQQAAQDVSQMGPDHPFSPGEPVGPYDGYSRTPRAFDYPTSYNVATRPRTHERVSFETLRGLIEAYDVAQVAIWHRIDSLRSLDWKLIAEDSFNGDVSDAVATGMAALKKPDGTNSFEAWFAKWMYDVLAYDAGALYRLRNRAGRCVGLAGVDGTTLAPLLDYWGNSPAEPAEAYVQYANGVPWNWLTRGDLIYQPFRPRNNSPYGQAPLESIIVNANTDIRFQLYFLQRFTSGNIPEAFASAPEGWSPEQVEQFQGWWDSFMYGEQAAKHQIKWMPGGSTIAWSNEKDFTDNFSLFLMRKSLAAYHVVPSDVGFTETVNYSSSESQADVGHRVGDLPLGRYAESIITSFLQDDLCLPLKFAFDWGEEQDDRLAQANADDAYIKNGVVGVSEIREMRFGLPEPKGVPVPRFIYTTRAGPIPLSSLADVAGPVDQATGAPEPGVPLPHKEFQLVEGVVPVPPPPAPALAERLYGPGAIPPALPAPPPPGALIPDGSAVSKEGETAGITSATGNVGYDGPGEHDDEDERAIDAAVMKSLARDELAAFRRFERARRKTGAWRDFTFGAVTPVQAHRLNDAGRLAVRKAAGEVACAGLAVQAQDTGRVLMLQRSLDPDDPAGGTWEFPGGHIEGTETPLQGAWREWAEETGSIPPPGQQGGMWTSANGIYQGIVWAVPSETDVPVRSGALVVNPDDPDGDSAEAIAWWDPADLLGNPVVRPELLASIDDVLAALRGSGDGQDTEVAKAGGGQRPKVEAPGLPDSIRPAVIRRRAKLLRGHLDTVQAAWDACMADLSPRGLVRDFREDAGVGQPVAKAAAQQQDWWKDVAVAAAVAWLNGLYETKGYVALVAAIEDAVRAGMAEGEADALAAAAARQGVTGLDIAEAFAQAYGRLEGDPGVSQRAQETLERIVQGAAADLGRKLAEDAGAGKGQQDMTSGVRELLTGAVRSVQSWLTDGMWAALGAGVKALLSRVTPDGGNALIAWETDGNPCAQCQDNEAGSPYAPEDVPDLPAHPNCQCNTYPVSDVPSSFFASLLGG